MTGAGKVVADLGNGNDAAEEGGQVGQRSSAPGAASHLERELDQLRCDPQLPALAGIHRLHAEREPRFRVLVREPLSRPGTGLRTDGLNSVFRNTSRLRPAHGDEPF